MSKQADQEERRLRYVAQWTVQRRTYALHRGEPVVASRYTMKLRKAKFAKP